jgi:putative salt-induced outer membrane protein
MKPRRVTMHGSFEPGRRERGLKTALVFPLVFLIVTGAALADPGSLDTLAGGGAPGKHDEGLAGSVALGYTNTTGNTDTSSLDARAQLSYGAGQWYHFGSVEKVRSTENGQTSADSLQAEAQSDYLFTSNNYVFAHLGYDKDEFSGVERRLSETAGYGRRLLNTATQTWSAQIGVGARQEDINDDGSRSSAIAQLATNYSWQFADNSSFGEGIVVERGADSTRIESATTLTVKMIDNFSLVVAYTIKHNTRVPPDTKKTDTYTSVALEYTF